MTIERKDSKKIVRLILLILGLVFTSFLFICLVTGKYMFGFGIALADFFKGFFGMSVYGIDVGFIIIFSLLISGKRVTVRPRYVINFAVMYCVIICLVHQITSSLYVADSTYSQYLTKCYDFASYPTFGGLLAGIIVFPLAKSYPIIGYVVFTVGIILTVLFATDFFNRLAVENARRDFVNMKNESSQDGTAKSNPKSVFVPSKQSSETTKIDDKPTVNPLDVLYGKKVDLDKVEFPERTKRETDFEQSIVKNSFLDLFPTKPATKQYDTAPTAKYEEPKKEEHEQPQDQQIRLDPSILFEPYDKQKENSSANKSAEDNSKQTNVGSSQQQQKPQSQPTQVKASQQTTARTIEEFNRNRTIPRPINDAPIIDGDTRTEQLRLQKQAEELKLQEERERIEAQEFEAKQAQEERDRLQGDHQSNDSTITNDDLSEEQTSVTQVDHTPTIKTYDTYDSPVHPTEILTSPQDADEKQEVSIDNSALSQTSQVDVTFREKPIPYSRENKGFQTMFEPKDNSKQIPPTPIHQYKKYVAPTLDLLNNIPIDQSIFEEDFKANAQMLEQTLAEFKIDAIVENIVTGPTVTRYELRMAPGISVKKVSNISDDIAMRLSAIGSVRVEAPISGKDLFGIEVPNKKTAMVTLRSIVDSPEFNRSYNNCLRFALGIDIGGQKVSPDLADMPHLLVAGSTGTGKSVCLNSLIISLMFHYSPEELRFILVDPKRVEFFVFNNSPHLMIKEVIDEPEKCISAFKWLIDEMERRYDLFAEIGAKDIATYNRIIDSSTTQKLPRIVLVVDELSDLMTYNKQEIETQIKRLAQKARAAGIHLVLATQRPSVDIITGVIKANLPCRIALRVLSQHDSKTILDTGGPEKLIGKGDMLFMTGNTPKPVRLQGAFVSMSEVDRVVEFIKRNNECYYDNNASDTILKTNQPNALEGDNEELDPLFWQALEYIVEVGTASISMLQRRFSIGYNRAGKIIEDLDQKKFISGFDNSKSRKVLITAEEFEKLFKNND